MNNYKIESITKDLTKLANHLDNIGKTKEADFVDMVLTKLSGEPPGDSILPGDMPHSQVSIEDIQEALENIPGYFFFKAEAEKFLVCIKNKMGNPLVKDEIPKNVLEIAKGCLAEADLAEEFKAVVAKVLKTLGGVPEKLSDL